MNQNHKLQTKLMEYKKYVVEIQEVYSVLIKYMAELRVQFESEYHVSSISLGYLDFTYFSLRTDILNEHKLRMAIVLNHAHLKFELWLLGQNQSVHRKYDRLFKDSQLYKNDQHQYAIIRKDINDSIDFSNEMTSHILTQVNAYIKQVEFELKKVS